MRRMRSELLKKLFSDKRISQEIIDSNEATEIDRGLKVLEEIRETLKIINRNPRFWQVDKWIAHLSEMIGGCN